MYLTIEKTDKNGVAKMENVELAFRRCTGYVEDKFFKAMNKIHESNLQMKMFGVMAKYIDEKSEDKEKEYQNAIMKATKAGELTIDEVTEMVNKNISHEDKKANRNAKIEALQACAIVDSKHMKEFEGKPDNDFWQSITSADIDSAISFFRNTNKI